MTIISISAREQFVLKQRHDRMMGALDYIVAHPETAFRSIAYMRVDEFFAAIEDHIPLGGDNPLDRRKRHDSA